MKKILSFAAMMAFGAMVTFAQSAESKPADKTETVEQAAPAVKAVEVNQSSAKCSSATGTKSCCSNSASRTSAVTTPAADATAPAATTTTETTTIEAAPAPSCHEVTVGMSAAKPEETEKTEDPKK